MSIIPNTIPYQIIIPINLHYPNINPHRMQNFARQNHRPTGRVHEAQQEVPDLHVTWRRISEKNGSESRYINESSTIQVLYNIDLRISKNILNSKSKTDLAL